jgi:hypothetical protein
MLRDAAAMAKCGGRIRNRWAMRAEIEKTVEEIKRSVGLLRRHL